MHLGSVFPGQIFPFNPKTFINGPNKSIILHGVNRKRPLWLMFFSNIDSGAAVRIKCDLNANEFFSASLSDLM